MITRPAFKTASGTAVAGRTTNATLEANGALSVALVPDAGYYTVVYQLGPASKERSIGKCRRARRRTGGGADDAGFGRSGQPVSMQYVNSELAIKANDSALVDGRGREAITGAKSLIKNGQNCRLPQCLYGGEEPGSATDRYPSAVMQGCKKVQ